MREFVKLFLIILISCAEGISSVTKKPGHYVTPMHMVLLTQRGYIQFLRWELPVPEIREFTFCLWVQSNNLTHAHSIFSYSKDERERLVRAWISPRGRRVHLEIGGVPVFAAASDIREHRWYHICQSWENQDGRYALWINGRVKAHGHSLETIDHVIPNGGDIVVGQEYTDFDKGLEEGIEGSVLGFNLLLASSFASLRKQYQQVTEGSQPNPSNYNSIPFIARVPMKIMQQNLPPDGVRFVAFPVVRRKRALVSKLPSDRTKRSVIGQLDFSLNDTRHERDIFSFQDGDDVLREVRNSPLGLQLVKLSYVRCEIGRGSPFIGGDLMLISWTRTPVRIFGGATVKNAANTCGRF